MTSAIQWCDDMAVPTLSPEMEVSAESMLAGPPGAGGASADAFLAIRMNDSTSYFFTWFCKHYRIKLKAHSTRCPICFEAVTNSIELSCGHTFCRGCLVASAAKNFSSCALCRREQVSLNPEVLRAQFDERRMLNLAKRLRSLGRDVAVPPVRPRPASSQTLVASSAAATSSGARRGHDGAASRKSCGAGAASASSKDAAALAAAGPTATAAAAGLGHLLSGPWGDVGAMPSDELRRRWTRLHRPAAGAAAGAAAFGAAGTSAFGDRVAFHDDVGAAPQRELRKRWLTLTAVGLAHCGADVGEGSVEELHARLSNAASPRSGSLQSRDAPIGRTKTANEALLRAAAAPALWPADAADAVEEDVGAMAAGELARRWAHLTALGRGGSGGDVGADHSAALRRRWASAFVGGASGDSDATSNAAFGLPKSQDKLRRRWTQASRLGAVAPPSPCDGADDGVTALAARWAAAHGADTSVGSVGVAAMCTHWAANESVGAANSAALYARWAAAGGADETVGAASTAALTARWAAAPGADKTIGAASAAALKARWQDADADGTVGAATTTARWRSPAAAGAATQAY
ncbi:unnamed protein product [Phaeothamnion confervicola]